MNALAKLQPIARAPSTVKHVAAEVEASPLRPPAFANLSAEQAAIFDELVALMPAHLHADADRISLAELARVLHRSQKCQAAIEKNGMTVRVVMTNGSTRTREAPAFRLQVQLFKQARRLMSDLGLCTATRTKLAPGSRPRRNAAKPLDRWGS